MEAVIASAPSRATDLASGEVRTLDVGGQRRVVLDVIGRVLADDVDDRRVGLLRVVQVGRRVGEAGTEMEQGAGRLVEHAGVAVGRSRHDAFEQAEDAAHAVDLVQRGDEMHFRRAGIGETDVDLVLDQRPDQTFRTVHRSLLHRAS
jgi:hypothetical protein